MATNCKPTNLQPLPDIQSRVKNRSRDLSDQKIHIVGCGPGSREYLTAQAQVAVDEAEIVIGPQQLLNLFQGVASRSMPTDKEISKSLDLIQSLVRQKNVAVLVSGDPGCFSLAKLIIQRFGIKRCRVVPGISSVQLALARVGLEWTRAKVLSVHGRDEQEVLDQIFNHNPCVILLGRELTWMSPIVEKLSDQREIFLMQDLGLPRERISTIKKKKDTEAEISSKSLLVIFSPQSIPGQES